MFLRRTSQLLVGAAVAAALTASLAVAATIQSYSQHFTVKSPGKSTGMTFTASARDPSAPGNVPTRAKQVTLEFPSGTKVNSAALPKCGNPSACPVSSEVGTGKAVVFLGSARLPLTAKVYNASGGLVLAVTNPLDPSKPIVLKPRIAGTKLSLSIPTIKVNGLTVVLSDLSVALRKIGAGSRAYTTTPKACPAVHTWTFKARFEYVDGSSKSLTSKSPCSRS